MQKHTTVKRNGAGFNASFVTSFKGQKEFIAVYINKLWPKEDVKQRKQWLKELYAEAVKEQEQNQT